MKQPLFLFVVCLFAFALPSMALAQYSSSAKDAPAIAQRSPDQKIQTMLLGVYHFNNPGADEFNTEVDDYFSDKRQKEIAECVAKLAEFKPTKIFVEVSPAHQGSLDEQYQAFLKGKLNLKDLNNGRSETYQLGFQIAKAAGLPGVHCVDAPGAWLGSDVEEVAVSTMPEFYDSVKREMERVDGELNKRIIANTVCENLIELNTTSSIMANHAYYNQRSTLIADTSKPTHLLFGTKNDGELEYKMIGVEQHNIGAELVGKWYTRNIKIFSNILRAIEKDDERILVIIGQGHIRPLQHFCEDHPVLDLVSPNDYLKSADQESGRKRPHAFESKGALQTLPFEWVETRYKNHIEPHNAMIVPVLVDGIATKFYMQFDTGSPYSFLRSGALEAMRNRGINFEMIENRGLIHFSGIELNIGGNQIVLKSGRVRERSAHIDWNNQDAVNIIGTIGSDLIDQRVCEMDFPNRQIRLHQSRPDNFDSLGSFTPFRFIGRRILLPATIDGTEVQLFYDSGSSSFGLLTSKYHFNRLAEEDGKGIRFNANRHGDPLPIEHKPSNVVARFGTVEIPLVRVSYVEQYVGLQNVFGGLVNGGALGNKCLLESTLILDTIANEFILFNEPNRNKGNGEK